MHFLKKIINFFIVGSCLMINSTYNIGIDGV